MDVQLPSTEGSAFMASHLHAFFDRFGINYAIDGPQLEYFVYERKTGQDISCSLTVSLDEAARQINVMTFYPGLCLLHGTRYFSAVCFFIVMQHFANFHHIRSDYQILLSTGPDAFDTFYSLLKDFDFHILINGEKGLVAIQSSFLSQTMDTSMINERPLECA
jgi:hypothetical protein